MGKARLLVTGDVHGNPMPRFSEDGMAFSGLSHPLTRDDTVIVLGDCGVPFGTRNPSYEEKWRGKDLATLQWMEKTGATFVLICGNHDDRDFVSSLPVAEEPDDPAIKQMVFEDHVYGNVFYIDEPTTIETCGKKMYVVPGAKSHDIAGGTPNPDDGDFEDRLYEAQCTGLPFRIEHWSWWRDEAIDVGKALEVEDWVRESGERIDYVLSHDCPADFAFRCLYKPTAGEFYLQHVLRDIDFGMLLHGHMHEDLLYGDGKCACMFRMIVDLLEDDPFGEWKREW